MTFQEVLFGLLSVHTRRTLLIKGKNWEGEVSIKGENIINVRVENDKVLRGIEGLKFIINRENEIDTVDLLPLKDEEGSCKIGQMELFSLLSDSFKLPEMEVFNDFAETIQANEVSSRSSEEIQTASEIEKKILRVSKEFFNRKSIKYVITNESNNLEIKAPILNLLKEISVYKDCNKGEIVISFSKCFLLVVYSREKFIALIVDSNELPDFKLNEPFIIGELRKILTSQN